MTIDEAIERLQLRVDCSKPKVADNFYESIKLGIEALREIKRCHETPGLHFVKYLPGEIGE